MAGFPRPADDLSEVSYNGFKFPPALSSRIESKPVYDDSGRQVIYVTHRIRIEFILHNGVDEQYRQEGVYTPIFPAIGFETVRGTMSDTALKKFREVVTKQGGHLVVNNIGFGGLRTSRSVGNADVRFGPRPQIVSWKDLAGGRAVQVTWACEVSIPEEPCAENTSLNVLVHNSTQNWDIDHRGVTTRTTQGYLIIRSNTIQTPTRIAGRTNLYGELQDAGSSQGTSRRGQIQVKQVADEYRSLVQLAELPGYQRQQSYELSQDKTRLNYSIVDTEIDSQNPFYPGTVEMTGQHRTSANNMTGDKNSNPYFWQSTISADIRVLKNRNLYWAWVAYQKIVDKRFKAMVSQAKLRAPEVNWEVVRKATGGTQEDFAQQTPLIWIRRFSFNESLFEPRIQFSVTFHVHCDPNFIFRAVSVGKPVYGKDTTWRGWLNELEDAHDIRGLSGLMYDKTTETLTGLCDPFLVPQDDEEEPEEPEDVDRKAPYPGLPKIEETNSWSAWQSELEYVEDSERIPHHVLEPNEYPADVYPSSPSPNAQGQQDGYTYGAQSRGAAGRPPIIQARTSSKYFVIYSGYAERVNFDIAQPVLINVGGVPAWPVGRLHLKKTSRRDQINGFRVTNARWRQVYQLASRPAGEQTAPSEQNYNYT